MNRYIIEITSKTSNEVGYFVARGIVSCHKQHAHVYTVEPVNTVNNFNLEHPLYTATAIKVP